jgi:hypothetical protein
MQITIALFVFAACILVVFGRRAIRRRSFPGLAQVTLQDIPRVFAKLREAGKDGSFAVFIFAPSGQPISRDALNVQFSLEDGRIGLDWVLLSPANVRDRNQFSSLVASLGYRLEEREMNGVRYLRVEAGDGLPGLCAKAITDLYSLPPGSKMNLITEGFEWP